MSNTTPNLDELARLRAEVESLRLEREQLSAALEYHERDRQLLAFEIHDGIVQDMTAAVMFLDAAGAHATFPSPSERESFAKGLRTLRSAIQQGRRLIQGLIPVNLDERGLAFSLESMIERFRDDCGLVVSFDAAVQPVEIKPAVALTLLRIVQEALNNVWKHSQSPKAEVRLSQVDNKLVVEVEDWGSGFDPAQVPKSRYGLIGVKERARFFNGTATVSSAPGRGTLIHVTLPWEGDPPPSTSTPAGS